MEHDYIKALSLIGEVYVVGGAIRNYIFNCIHNKNIKIKDYDYLVRLIQEDQLLSTLEKFGNVKKVGQAFGVIILNPMGTKDTFEFAIPRTEVSTGTGYRDFNIVLDKNLPIEVDFSRRDATINAIGMRVFSLQDLKKLDHAIFPTFNIKDFIDPFKGIPDIQNKIWRCVGDPTKRFLEDPTRIMRAFRQSADLELKLDEVTFDAIIKNSKLLETLIPKSFVRLYNELAKIITYKNCMPFLLTMKDIGILEILGISNFTGLDVTLAKYNITKMALLIRPELIKDDIKQWAQYRQLPATTYFNSDDVIYLQIIQRFSNSIKTIRSIIDLLLFREKIYWNVQMKYDMALKILSEYIFLSNQINDEQYQFLLQLLVECGKYPVATEQLNISGDDIIRIAKVSGKKVGEIKEMLLHEIFTNKLINENKILIDYVTNNFMLGEYNE